ncbi:hypothetical protein DXG03_008032 [Asterophora parasitica]|uniref:Uncharacterized protein n=1 Tax=Asterophora parasitica TaxID=117018 RepID=A0A9P7GC97_9AGAR|nr:hypothetical protein DXG03_008032 [Asterophora parasitica]
MSTKDIRAKFAITTITRRVSKARNDSNCDGSIGKRDTTADTAAPRRASLSGILGRPFDTRSLADSLAFDSWDTALCIGAALEGILAPASLPIYKDCGCTDAFAKLSVALLEGWRRVDAGNWSAIAPRNDRTSWVSDRKIVDRGAGDLTVSFKKKNVTKNERTERVMGPMDARKYGYDSKKSAVLNASGTRSAGGERYSPMSGPIWSKSAK